MPEPPEYLWNHRVHQHWADEDLTFWRLAFFPRYRREKVLDTISEVMKSEQVSSYVVYETLGLFDIFVRAWLPSQGLERFEKALNDALQGEYLQLLESFTVTRILRHHVWDDVDGELQEPPPEVLLARLSDTEIDAINRGELTPARRNELETAHIIGKRAGGNGVKFFTIITSPVYSTTFEGRTRLVENLLKILGESDIEEPSLYEGGGFGRFILMGRTPSENFFSIPRLAREINDLGIYEALTARPYTHVCSDKGVMACVDEIPTTASQERIDIEDMLRSSESHELEVKGSLRLNLGRWLSGEDAELKSEDAIANDGVIKAIVGMLNASGGRVVIGALERDKKFGPYTAETHPLLEGYEQVGNYVVLGIDAEDAFRAKKWDGFQLQLQDLIGSRIDPSPAGLIGIDEEKVADRTLCVLSIQPSTSTWFYRRLGAGQAVKFYVREDGRTVAYAGSEADNYKRANPRG